MNALETEFSLHGFNVTKKESNVYQINQSDGLINRIAEQIIINAKYSPIISENRMDDNIEFTVIPYAKPNSFEKVLCSNIEMSSDELIDSIESTYSLLKEGIPVFNQGIRVFDSVLEGENKMVGSCLRKASFLLDFLDKAPLSGRALDVGCGQGINSLPLLKKGWHVVAIDKLTVSLDLYKQKANEIDQSFLKTGRLNLKKEDVTSSDLGINLFNAVVCIDVLPYINSKKLKSLIDKIYTALIPNGDFFGTLFFSVPENENIEVLLRQLGAHFYSKEYIAYSLLKHSGFNVEECSIRLSAGFRTGCVQFIAKKPA